MNLEELESLTLDRVDLELLLSNYRNYLKYCESHLGWQRRVKLKALELETQAGRAITPEEHFQLEDHINVDYQIALPSAIRHAGLVMLVTLIEWFFKFCDSYAEKRG